jgi:hypothetical protein
MIVMVSSYRAFHGLPETRPLAEEARGTGLCMWMEKAESINVEMMGRN